MGQILHENVPSSSNNAGTKSQQKLCQFFLNIKNNKGLTKYELSKEFDLSEAAIKKRLFLHRKKLPCISLESGSNLYRHDKNKCRLVGQKQRELVKQNVPPKVATSPGRKDQLISSNNYVVAWLSNKFHVSESIIDDLLEFTWRDQIIEIHGAMYETQTDYRPDQKEEYELPQLVCNKYSKVYVQIYPSGKLTVHMGPAVINNKRAKYGFSPFGVPLSKFENEAEKFIESKIKVKVILRNRIIQCDLAVDNHRVHSCLNRPAIPIIVDGVEVMRGQEYMVERGEDHPHYNEPDFIKGEEIRRQEIRFLNRQSMELIPFVHDLMKRQLEDVKSGIAIKRMSDHLLDINERLEYSLEEQRQFSINQVYSNNLMQQQLMRIHEDHGIIKSQNTENYFMNLKIRQDIDVRSTSQDSKLNRTASDLAQISEQIEKSNSDLNSNFSVLISQNDVRNDLLRDNNELQIINGTKLDGINKLLKEIKNQQLHQNTDSEAVKWRKIDSGTKLFMVATLYKLYGSFTKVAEEIQKEFKVTRQALDKLVRSRTKNWEGDILDKMDKLLSSISINKVVTGGTISKDKSDSSNFAYTNKSSSTGDNDKELPEIKGGTFSGTKIFFGNFSYTDDLRIQKRIKTILQISADNPSLSKSQLSKLSGGSKDRTLILIQYLIDNGYLISTSPNPARPKWTKITRSDKKYE